MQNRENITKIESINSFWYWIDERHRIYLNRQKGMPKPWTKDPAMLDFKFTNVFRELDTGTIWLRENFLEPHKDDHMTLLVFNICWYRKYNWYRTGEILGWRKSWKAEEIIELLRPHSRGKLITGAHFSIAEPGYPRWEGMAYICENLWKVKGQITQVARSTQSLKSTFEEILKVSYIGPFLAYEMVTDIRHTRVLEDAWDINLWANPGGGALRGLRRLGLPHTPTVEAITSMKRLLDMSHTATGPHVPEMELRDIEHSLCEFDKWSRIINGEGRPRSMYNGRS